MQIGVLALLGLVLLWLPHAVAGQSSHATDPIAPVVLGATGILFFALVGRFISQSLEQPPVLGELLMGIALGNLAGIFDYELVMVLREGASLFANFNMSSHADSLSATANLTLPPAVRDVLQRSNGTEILQVGHVVDVFARYGALFLLFYVGLGTSLDELREVGSESTAVALTGVLAPFFLGLTALHFLLPEAAYNTTLFIAATLTATSVGITAAVLEDLNQEHSHEARVILGAAVIDDILGLILLAIVAGIVHSGSLELSSGVAIVLRAGIFFCGAIVLGPTFLRMYIAAASRLPVVEAKLFVSIIFAMGMSWVADLFGLASIIGAFTAGVILSDGYFRGWEKKDRRRYRIRDLIMPIEMILVPFFFVLMGIQVKLEGFLNWEVAELSATLVLVAIVGKLLAGFFTRKGTRSWIVGIGMLPRGEVGLVFASIGKALGVIDANVFSAIVVMIIVTTLLAPMLLKQAFPKAHAPDN